MALWLTYGARLHYYITLNMKREMDVIRALLLAEESGNENFVKRYTPEQLAYNTQLLIDAGLILGHANPVVDEKYPSHYQIYRLTWTGHDFLDAARNNTIWKKAKERVLRPATSWTFSILLEYLKAEAKQRLGVPDT